MREGVDLVERIVCAAEERPDAVAVADRLRTWDRAHVVGRAGGLAELLRPIRGGVAAVLAGDARDLAVAALATLAVGVTLVPLDPRQGPDRLRRTLRDLGVTVLLDGTASDRAAPTQIDVRTIALRGLPSAPLRPEAVPGDAVAVLFMSSGSTGEPKPVPRTRADMAEILSSPMERYLRPGDRLGTLLGATGAAVRRLIGALDAGIPIHMLDARGVGPDVLLAAFAAARVTVLNLIPTYLRRLIGAAQAGSTPALPDLRLVATVGEPLTWADVGAVRAHLNPGSGLLNRYGSTDAASISHRHIPPDEPVGVGAVPVGRPHEGVTIRIEDDRGREVATGTAGEVVIDSPRRRENPTRVELPDGRYRYRTGDLGRLLPDGQLELLGRVDRLVKIGGIRVEPMRVEAALRELPWVDEAFVDADPVTAPPTLTAHVTVREGAMVGDPDPVDFLSARLHEAELPRRLVRHEGGFPTLLTGKVDGLELRRRAAAPETHEIPLGIRPVG